MFLTPTLASLHDLTVFIVEDTYVMPPKAFSWMSPTHSALFLLVTPAEWFAQRKAKMFNKSIALWNRFQGKVIFMSSAHCQTAECILFLFQYFVFSCVDGLIGSYSFCVLAARGCLIHICRICENKHLPVLHLVKDSSCPILISANWI